MEDYGWGITTWPEKKAFCSYCCVVHKGPLLCCLSQSCVLQTEKGGNMSNLIRLNSTLWYPDVTF